MKRRKTSARSTFTAAERARIEAVLLAETRRQVLEFAIAAVNNLSPGELSDLHKALKDRLLCNGGGRGREIVEQIQKPAAVRRSSEACSVSQRLRDLKALTKRLAENRAVQEVRS